MDRTEWLEARRRGITGTDIAAIAGISRWKNALDVWYEKKGLAEPTPENEAMRWGTLQEPIIADFFAERHGVALTNPGLMAHASLPFVIGTPDRLIEGKQEGLEIKTASLRKANEWGDEGSNQIPDEYFIQSQWYMLLTGFPLWHVAVKIDAADYREYEVAANHKIMSRLQELADDFWHTNVEGDVKPTPKEGGAYPSAYLAKVKDDGTMLTFDTSSLALAERYARAKAAADAANEELERYKSALQAVIGEAAGIECDAYKITWKNNKASAKTDWEAVARECGASEEIIKAHTQTKPGPRVFRFKEVNK